MNTDTPRTNDAAFMAIHIDGNGVPTEFARKLERELAEVTEQRDGITLRLGQTQERMIDAERQRDRLAEALRKWDAACAAAEKCNAYQHSEQFKYRQWKTLSNRYERLLADAESEKNEVLALIDSRKNVKGHASPEHASLLDAETAPHDGTMILADFGWPWLVPAAWSRMRGTWQVAVYNASAETVTSTEVNDCWWEFETEDNRDLKGWMPIPPTNTHL
jgi:hypothetical protein